MRSLIRGLLVASVALGAIVGRAGAQVVVNGGPPNEGFGWNIFDDNRAATVFKASGPIAFDAIRFWGILPDGPTYTPNIFWQILNNDGGAPGTTVAAEGNGSTSAVVRTELVAFPGFFSWQFDLSAGPQTLAAGVYWLALHDGPLDPTVVTGSTLIWETTDVGDYAIQTFSVDDHWDVVPDDGLAFELRATPVSTPEPASLVLTATGLIGLAGVVRRMRRAR